MSTSGEKLGLIGKVREWAKLPENVERLKEALT